MNPTLIVAIIGLLTTAAAPLLQTWLSAKHERLTWTRDAQIEVFSAALGYAEHLTGMVDNLTQPYSGSLPKYEMDKDAISGRMRLLAPSNVVQAWSDLLEAKETLTWNLTESGPPGFGDDPSVALPDSDPDLVRLKAAINGLTKSVREPPWV